MSFLRRLFAGDQSSAEDDAGAAPVSDAEIEEEERAHELELARFEQERTSDLVRRQQRYSNQRWTPPSQGGGRRADDDAGERAGDGGGA